MNQQGFWSGSQPFFIWYMAIQICSYRGFSLLILFYYFYFFYFCFPLLLPGLVFWVRSSLWCPNFFLSHSFLSFSLSGLSFFFLDFFAFLISFLLLEQIVWHLFIWFKGVVITLFLMLVRTTIVNLIFDLLWGIRCDWSSNGIIPFWNLKAWSN